MLYEDSVLFRPAFRKFLPGLVGAGLGSALAAIRSGAEAYRQARKDSANKFVTWSERPAPRPVVRRSVPRATVMKRRLPSGRRYRRRYVRVKRGKSLGDGYAKRMVRTTGLLGTAIAAASTQYTNTNITLDLVQISDLTAAYRLFRIRKVVLHLVPRVDTANSGLANNFQCLIAAACDPESTAVPASITEITAYDNSYQKFVSSGEHFTYTFYPKAVNAVGNAGATAYVGSYGMNPWLQLNAGGASIIHQALKLGFQVGSASTISFQYFFEIHFDVKGQA